MDENYEIEPIPVATPEEPKLTANEARKRVKQLEAKNRELANYNQQLLDVCNRFEKGVHKRLEKMADMQHKIDSLANAYASLLQLLDLQVNVNRDYVKLILEKENDAHEKS